MGASDKSDAEKSGGGCMMGSSWQTYVVCIVAAIIFIILVIWISSYWFVNNQCPTGSYEGSGKSVLTQFSHNSVTAAK